MYAADPITAGAILAATAGSVINGKSQADAAAEQVRQQNAAARKAMEARQAEQVRQRAIEEDNYDEVRQALVDIDPGARAELVASEVAEGDTAVQQAAERYSSLPRSTDVAGQVLGDAGRLRDEADRTRAMIDALATLSRQGVGTGSVSDRLGRFGAALSNNGSQSQRSAGVANFEASVPAATVTPSSSVFGDILIAGGQAAGLAGGGVANPFANWDLAGKKGAFSPGGA